MESGTREQVLHFSSGSEPKDLDPNLMVAAVEYTLLSALFEGLVVISSDGKRILPGVAERWDISEDQLTYTFHLRSDARWSDGRPVTAQDFLASFRRVFSPSIGAQGADWGLAIAGARDVYSGRSKDVESIGVQAPDVRTVVIRLDYPSPHFLQVVGGAPFMPIPRHVLERHGGMERPNTPWTRPGELVSNGPFVLSEWIPNSRMIVTRNPRYWAADRVRLREIRFYPYDQPEVEERAFRTGLLHVTHRLPIAKLPLYRDAPNSPLRINRIHQTTFLFMNTRRPALADPRVRRALSLALDRERMVPAVMKEAASPATSLVRSPIGDYTVPPANRFDLESARRLLAEAGHEGGAGLPEIELVTQPMGHLREMAEVVQQQWKRELGVAARILQQESKVVFDSLDSGAYDIGLSGFFYGLEAPELVFVLLTSDSPGNDTGWKDAAFDADFAAARRARTRAEAHAAYDRMEERLRREVPLAPLFHTNLCQLVHPAVRGWQANANYSIDWRELSLEAER